MALRGPSRRANRRDNPRPGSARGPRYATPAGEAEPTTPVVQATVPPPPRPAPASHGLGLTRRALALVAVLAVLGLSYARSLTVYLSQQREIEATQQANDVSRARIAQLEDDVARWSDPDYVRAQARQRLGWVLPGEIGYRVIGPDGTVLGADAASPGAPVNPDAGPWYAQVWASVKSADLPLTNAEAIPPDGSDIVVAPSDEATPG